MTYAKSNEWSGNGRRRVSAMAYWGDRPALGTLRATRTLCGAASQVQADQPRSPSWQVAAEHGDLLLQVVVLDVSREFPHVGLRDLREMRRDVARRAGLGMEESAAVHGTARRGAGPVGEDEVAFQVAACLRPREAAGADP